MRIDEDKAKNGKQDLGLGLAHQTVVNMNWF